MSTPLDPSEGSSSSEYKLVDDLLTPMLEASMGQGRSALSADDLDRLRQVAINSDAEGATLQQFAISLVKEFLKFRLPLSVLAEVSPENMATLIGESLSRDPYSKQRLSEFRKYLLESH